MAELKGGGGEVRMTIHIKRKATGKVETHELVGRVMPEPEQPKDEHKEDKGDGAHAQHHST